MRRVQKLSAAAAMFLWIIVMLLTSFQIGIYGDPEYKFYEERYEKYQVTEELHMELSDVMEVTDYMMDYLIGREDELTFVTDVDGREQDFFNEQDRLHMADVKNLFLGGLKLRNLLLVLVVLICGGLVFTKCDMRRTLGRAYAIAFGVFAGLGIFLAVAFSIDFTSCFRIFHEIFFTNDLWMFDPAEDYMIRMLPEGFFSDMVLRIAGIFAAGLLLVALVFALWGRLAGKIGRRQEQTER